MKQVTIIGAGMGTEQTMTGEAIHKIQEAELLIGAGRLLEPYRDAGKELVTEYRTEQIVTLIRECRAEKIAVLMSGDSGFFSGTKGLYQELLKYQEELAADIMPGISSVAVLAAKAGISWEDAGFLSAHGREADLIPALGRHAKIFVLAGNEPERLIAEAVENGFAGCEVWAGERLGTKKERIRHGSAGELRNEIFDPLTVFLFLPEIRRRRSFGLSEEEFCLGSAPVTKSEVRAVVLSRLALLPGDIMYDIGAGTGSVSVEAAMELSEGKVYAVEKKPEAVGLIRENTRKFGLHNVTIIEGEAPDCLEDASASRKTPDCLGSASAGLETPDVAFLGGTSGNMEGIIQWFLNQNPGIHLVLTAVTLESQAEVLALLEKYRFTNVEISQIQVSRAKQAGRYHLMEGMNPVWVISADGEGE